MNKLKGSKLTDNIIRIVTYIICMSILVNLVLWYHYNVST